MVLRVYNELKDFINSCVQFSEDLHLSQAEIDETVRKSTNILLTRTLSGCLSSLIRKDKLSLIQLIQIDINTHYLEETNVHLEKYISEITGRRIENAPPPNAKLDSFFFQVLLLRRRILPGFRVDQYSKISVLKPRRRSIRN